ncbi:MAG TPA: PhzF family phenazine biosynthesis isomerase [Jatrophihabitantaceae bacterium]|nr:PhzF family phenazine biosynthesis isomerase [Jatrophihabitantaceae bacterium]
MNPELEGRILRYAAFTDGGVGGNPAGVVLDADDLDDATRLAIAAHVGYSETAYIDTPHSDGSYRVRYFSPLAEVDFCGHATIAATVALAERGASGELVFDTRPGPIEVGTTRTVDGGQAATLTSVAPRTRPADADELRRALAAFGWAADDLDPRYPSHVAYAGNDHLVLALRERAALAALDYEFEALGVLMVERSWTTVHVVWAQERTVFHARDPFPPGGVVEDPATGAAAAAFGGYLRALGLVDVPGEVTVLQGADMGRPSRLTVGIPAEGGIRVTGTAAPVG